MWIVIGIVAAIFILRFIGKNLEQQKNVEKQGGMLNKYAHLANYILAGDPRTEISKITSDSLHIVLSSVGGGSTAFHLYQTFGKLTVQWKVASPVLGTHSLEWNFPEFLEQEKMVARINNDLMKYQQNVLTAKNY